MDSSNQESKFEI